MASARSRRTARRRARTLKEARRTAVEDRHAARLAHWRTTQTEQGLDVFGWAPGMPRMSRRELRLTRYPSGSVKQDYKHLDKRAARWDARREARRARVEAALAPATAAAGWPLVRLEQFGGFCPMTASGRVLGAGGAELLFTFRFRYDRAFLEIGHPDPDEPALVGEAVAAASWDDVTGEPYAGELDDARAVQVLAALFAGAGAPKVGERFGERFTNTLDLALGRGGDPALPTLAR